VGHVLWHIFVLVAALTGAASTLILVAGPVLFGASLPPPRRSRLLLTGVALAVLALLSEWLVIH
jgi:hypothetical protein